MRVVVTVLTEALSVKTASPSRGTAVRTGHPQPVTCTQIIIIVQFISRWYLCARESPYALRSNPSLRNFPSVAFETFFVGCFLFCFVLFVCLFVCLFVLFLLLFFLFLKIHFYYKDIYMGHSRTFEDMRHWWIQHLISDTHMKWKNILDNEWLTTRRLHRLEITIH